MRVHTSLVEDNEGAEIGDICGAGLGAGLG